MASTCPGCRKKFGIFDRIAGVPLCLACQKSGVQVPRHAVRKEESKTDLLAGWGLAIAAVAFAVFVIVVPVRKGASQSGKLRLIGYALIPFGAGIGMIDRAKARLKRK